MSTHVLVTAKAPVAGQVKTRLCPPCEPGQAAAIAEAALSDTLDAVAACGADRKLIALDGAPGPWLPEGFEVFAQEDVAFDGRLAAAWDRAGGPGVQIGMDTPQVVPAGLDAALDTLLEPGVGAVLGPALDGGWWLIGLREADRRVFEGIPMSRSDTILHQRARLADLDLATVELGVHRDLDHFDDARAIAEMIPTSRTAEAVGAVLRTLETSP